MQFVNELYQQSISGRVIIYQSRIVSVVGGYLLSPQLKITFTSLQSNLLKHTLSLHRK